MKKTITIIVLSFVWVSAFSQTGVPDTIYNIQWELLDAPSGKAKGFAKSGNRLFAAPHFYSDDMGENWKQIPGYFGMDHITASDRVVFLNDSKVFGVYRGSGGMREFRIYKSSGGNSFNLLQNRRMIFGGRNGVDNSRYDELSPLVKVNDSVFVYSKFHTFYLNPPNIPDEKIFFTRDAGTTWDSLPINARDQISVFNDTVRIFNRNTNQSLIYGNDDFTSPIIDRTGSHKGMIYAKGKYFYLSNNRYLNVSSDRGATWEKEEVPSYAFYYPPGRLKYFDNHIYFSDYRSIYKSSIDDPFNFEEIYHSPFEDKESSIIFELFDGIWLLNDIDGIHRSTDNGLTWERKTKGLTNFNDRGFGSSGVLLQTGDRIYLGAGASIRRSSTTGNTWEVLNNSFFIEHYLLGYAQGFLFARRNADGHILRSRDSGLTWEDTGFIRQGLFMITSDKIISGDHFSEDQGLTWTEFNYQSGLTTTYQDTFLAFRNLGSENMIRHISIDKGITWNSDTVFSMQMNKVGEIGDTLISFFQNRIAYSPDHGKSWIKSEEIEPLNCYTPTICTDPILNGFVDGLIIVQSDNAMQVSRNLGETWKVIKDVPFGDSLFHGLWHLEDYTEGGGEFLLKDGFLYAYKRSQGVYRTPIDPILDALTSTVSDIGKISGRIYINLDNDCAYDPSIDRSLANKLVQISNELTTTDSEGNYSLFLRVGDYEATTLRPDFHESACNSEDTVSIQVNNHTLQTVDFVFSLIPELGEITGRVYVDRDSDCIYNSIVDKPLANQIVQISNLYAITNSEGEYHSLLEFKDYDVTTLKPNLHESICNSGDTVSIQVDSRTLQTVDFAFNPIPGLYDLKVWLSANQRPRPGFQNTFTITVRNIGTESITGAPVTFNFDPSKYQIIDAGGGTVDGENITFITNLVVVEQVTLKVILELFPTVPLGMLDTVSAVVDLPNDIDQSNNKAVLKRTVTGAYDPNDKTTMSQSQIFPLTENEIEYLIRFQNTGTDTAFTVRVVDTIASQFNLLTLEMIDASHHYELTIEENRELVWQFENILLPDSTTNEPLSHGYIHFSIQTDSTVADMDTLKNDAAIYFDFNEPIITNEAQNEVKKGIFEQVTNYEICEGDEVNGQTYFSTTTISDTLVGMIWDSIYTSEIEVNPVYSFSNDVTVSPGDTFNNIVVNADTVLVENYLTEFGCDSMITTNLMVLSSTNQIENKRSNVIAFPNPFNNELNFKIRSESSGAALIQIYDVLGRLILEKPIHLIIGDNLKTIDTTNLPPGILTTKISNSEHEFQRIQVLKNR